MANASNSSESSIRLDKTQEEMCDAGSRKLYNKPWTELVKDFERIGKSPSASFIASVMVVGAAAAVESLRGAGRMVGIITHIRELADRLPCRIVVERRHEGSWVQVQVG